jgi:hypothetical protein
MYRPIILALMLLLAACSTTPLKDEPVGFQLAPGSMITTVVACKEPTDTEIMYEALKVNNVPLQQTLIGQGKCFPNTMSEPTKFVKTLKEGKDFEGDIIQLVRFLGADGNNYTAIYFPDLDPLYKKS